MPKASRQTRQKEMLKDELGGFRYFFTADELHDRAKRRDSRLGIATVYRFLKGMARSEAIHSYKCGKKTVYSARANNHSHFTCQRCGEVSHLDIDSLKFIQDKLGGGKICHFQVNVEGLCKKCQKQSTHA